MAEWWEPILPFFKDWSLVIATVALAVSTFFLAKYTKAMAKQTKATEELTRASIRASEALQTMPAIDFTGAQPLSDGDGKYSRFSVKNFGYGHAKNLSIKVTTKDGRVVPVKPWSKTDIIETNNLFYWDAYDVRLGEELFIEITFTDIRGVQYPSFNYSYTVI